MFSSFSILFLIVGTLAYHYVLSPIWKERRFKVVYFCITIILVLSVATSLIMIHYKMPIGFTIRNIAGGSLIVLFLTKFWILLSYSIFRTIGFFGKILQKKTLTVDEKKSRRKFLSKAILASTSVPFSSLLYSVFKGRYNFYVKNLTLFFPDLPESFDGYRITHISDIHCGSFDNRSAVLDGVQMVNDQRSDIILFTGDVVNERSDELIRWKDIFSQFSAPDGVFSVLGNHDYSDYAVWDSMQDKLDDQRNLRLHQKEMGWNLLLNEHHILRKGKDEIALVGVENWGKGRFIKRGDLTHASQGLSKNMFKVLMSHDPSHWDAKIRQHAKNFQLTLSGHTHGMQFGIAIPGLIKWSPAKYLYKQWDGLYRTNNHFIHVNRGFGTLGFPGRLGIWPEISVLSLRKS